MSKCILCGTETEGAILCPDCLQKTDEPITKAEVNCFLTGGILYMYCDRFDFQAKNPKKNITIYYKDINQHKIIMKNLLDLDYGCGKNDSFAFDSPKLAEKWEQALCGLLALCDRSAFDCMDVLPEIPKSPIEPINAPKEQNAPTAEETPSLMEEPPTPAEEIKSAPEKEFTEDAHPIQAENSEESTVTEENTSSSGFSLGNLSLKGIIAIAASIAVVFVIFSNIFGGKNNNDLAKEIAVYQIQQQTYAVDESVYDIKIVDKDGKGRYIVTATTKPGAFETWWAVYVEICDDNDHYRAVANYHGDGITTDEWITTYKTNDNYNWGDKRAKAD